MRISLDSPEIKQFNPDPAIHLWQKAVVRGRRPSQKIWKKAKKNKENGNDNIESDAVSESDSELSDQADQQVEQESMPLNTQSQTIRDLFESDSDEPEFEGFDFD